MQNNHRNKKARKNMAFLFKRNERITQSKMMGFIKQMSLSLPLKKMHS